MNGFNLYEAVCDFIKTQEICSISQLQRKFYISYITAKQIVDRLELEGKIIRGEGSNPNKVVNVEVK